MITIGTTTAPCPLCEYFGRRSSCPACQGTGRIYQAIHLREEPTA
ncbi:hypothetical protein ACLBWP_03485 [Microbacterium sp. M1A1_1b]